MDLQQNAQAVPVIRTQPQQSLGCAFIDENGQEVLIMKESDIMGVITDGNAKKKAA